MSDIQQYTTIVLKTAAVNIIKEARENEQAIQPFTQTPSAGQPGSEKNDGLHPDELFFFYTAEVIRKRTVFTR